MKETFPAVEHVLKYIPSPSTTSSGSTSSIPSDSEPGGKILFKIEESKIGLSESDLSNMPNDSVHGTVADISLEDLAPSENATTTSHISSHPDGTVVKGGDGVTEGNVDGSEKIPDVIPIDPKQVVDIENVGKRTTKTETKKVDESSEHDMKSTTEKIDVVAHVDTSTAVENASDSTSTVDVMSGKSKLARLLGKGGYEPHSVEGKDVIDHSSFGKPKPRPSSNSSSPTSTTSTSKCPVKHQKKPYAPVTDIVKSVTSSSKTTSFSVPSPTSKAPVIPEAVSEKSGWNTVVSTGRESKGEEKDVGSVEVEALRSELASQAKWEAVRLQEAVRAQLVEDKKAAAKEIAEIEQRHAEELIRLGEEAAKSTHNLISEKAEEFKKLSIEKRDEEVKKIVSEKEEELREHLNAEYSGREAMKSMERENALGKAEANVTTLSQRFDSVITQTERAKEATQRASGAFVLREAIGYNNMPLGNALRMATGSSDLASVVVKSLPEGAVKNGVRSVDGLRDDFIKASRRGLSAAAVPESKKGSIWAHALGSVFSRLKIAVDVRMDGIEELTTNEQRIRVAQLLVKDGDIEGAVKALEGVDGLSKDVLGDWLNAAKCRIAASQAADVLLADAIISQVSLMN